MSAPTLPTSLRAIGVERLTLPDGTRLTVAKTKLTLTRWRGAPVVNTFGGKPLIDVDGAPMFAELAVLTRLVADGWDVRWIEPAPAGAEPYLLTEWLDAPLTEQVTVPIPVPAIRARLRAVSSVNKPAGYGGCWDLLAWRGEERLFVEVKLAGKDRLRPTQLGWLDAALRCGFTASQFLIVDWEFTP